MRRMFWPIWGRNSNLYIVDVGEISYRINEIENYLRFSQKNSCIFWRAMVLYWSGRENRSKTVGVDYGEGPPVPIPNTEVKLVRAEDTWLEAAWKNRCSPTQRTVSYEIVLLLLELLLADPGKPDSGFAFSMGKPWNRTAQHPQCPWVGRTGRLP